MGTLDGIRILEIGGIGPVPFAGMMLSDMGAEIVRIERMPADAEQDLPSGILERNRKRIAIDLKSPEGIELVLRLVERSDVLLEGFRPGVMERFGLGPDVCCARNEGLVFGRMSGWGQDGPLATVAGHDLTYISVVGVTAMIGTADRRPMPPLNLVGDYGGGGMMLALGVCAALYERSRSGKGQVIDAAMCDGAALLTNTVYELIQRGQWRPQREANALDGGAHFYNTYETADGLYMAVAAAEPQFYRALLIELGLGDDQDMLAHQMDSNRWPEFRTRMAAAFKTCTRAEWVARMLHNDMCAAPVLSFDEARHFPQNKARNLFVEVDGLDQAAPAPRFSRTPSAAPVAASVLGAERQDILLLAGIEAGDIERLVEERIVI